MELSIIVPVYNCESYIERTVGLLLTQQLDSYEIVLVDDGSEDSSPVLCDELARKNDNIRVLHIQNSGPGHARNVGIDNAEGKYIAFCDADDQPAANMYGRMVSIMGKEGVDFVICDIFSERDNRAFGFPWGDTNVSFSGDEVVSHLLASMIGNMSDNDTQTPVWGSSVRCIYRKDILDKYKIRFPEDIRFAEDLVFNIRYIKNISSCFVLNEALYRYTFNNDSLMNSHVRYNKNAFNERVKLVEYIEDEIAPISPIGDGLKHRFLTSQRCYFLESVGNAARAVKTEGRSCALSEIRTIVNHPMVTKAFESFDAKQIKKKLSYLLIQKKLARVLLAYFSIRLR